MANACHRATGLPGVRCKRLLGPAPAHGPDPSHPTPGGRGRATRNKAWCPRRLAALDELSWSIAVFSLGRSLSFVLDHRCLLSWPITDVWPGVLLGLGLPRLSLVPGVRWPLCLRVLGVFSRPQGLTLRFTCPREPYGEHLPHTNRAPWGQVPGRASGCPTGPPTDPYVRN